MPPPLSAAAADTRHSEPIGLQAQMLPLAAHFSRRSQGEASGKQEAPAAAPAGVPPAAAPAKPAATEEPPVKDPSTGEAFPATQRFW